MGASHAPLPDEGNFAPDAYTPATNPDDRPSWTFNGPSIETKALSGQAEELQVCLVRTENPDKSRSDELHIGSA